MLRGGLRLGKIFGITVSIDWSWFFILILLTWSLAVSVFPTLHPEWSTGLYWGIGLIAAILFFLSVLAHELAHSLVAISKGLPVRRITLYLFGGVSNIEREPDTPAAEFLTAVVGPLTSIILGVIFLLLGRASLGDLPGALSNPTQIIRGLNPLGTILLWLGPINILLGIFNLIPGFPLDGGRILRSIFWALTNNLRKATRWATWIGQLIAWTFIVIGFAMVFGLKIPYFGTGVISGLWLAFIGWFLNNAATTSYQRVVIEDMLEGIPVTRLMRVDHPTVTADTSVADLVDHHFMGTDERAFPVVEENRLLGLVAMEDVRKVPRADWDNTQVHAIMTPIEKLEIVSPREDAFEAFNKLTQKDVRQIPVVQDGKLMGVLRRQDIMRWLQLHSDAVPG
ncbi:MAG TPA: site-2 protease family protein [Anaerolineaceae bacterium]|nr:site-2 protease family protein [Anaerolineaceae bacterium]